MRAPRYYVRERSRPRLYPMRVSHNFFQRQEERRGRAFGKWSKWKPIRVLASLEAAEVWCRRNAKRQTATYQIGIFHKGRRL